MNNIKEFQKIEKLCELTDERGRIIRLEYGEELKNYISHNFLPLSVLEQWVRETEYEAITLGNKKVIDSQEFQTFINKYKQ